MVSVLTSFLALPWLLVTHGSNLRGDLLKRVDKHSTKRSDCLLADVVNLLVAEKREREILQEENKVMKKAMAEIRKRFDTKVTDLAKKCSRQFKNIQNQLDTTKQSVTAHIRKSSDQFAAIKKQSANQNISVAFSAKLTAATSATSSGLQFSTIISNIGGGYNGSDGVFYCPKDGLYLFSVTVMGYKDRNYVRADFMKNTSQLALFFEQGSGNSYRTASLTLGLNLRTGDRIWIKGTGIIYYEYSYFTGILIKQ